MTPEPSIGPTSSTCLEELLIHGVAVVHRTAAFALDPDEKLHIEAEVHHDDLVTQVGRGIEGRIVGHLEATGVPVHGEEVHRVEDFETYRGRAWVLDPIDGTLNYVATHRDQIISLALVGDNVPTLAVLADPVAGRLYMAIHGWDAWVRPLLAGSADADDATPWALERLEDLLLSEGILIAHYQLTQDTGVDQAIEVSCGMRCYEAAALEVAEVTADGAVIYAQPRFRPWDVTAGTLLCAGTSAALTQVDGALFDVRRAGSLLVGTPTAYAEVLGHLHVVEA